MTIRAVPVYRASILGAIQTVHATPDPDGPGWALPAPGDPPPTYGYLPDLGWTDDRRAVLVIALERSQNHLDMMTAAVREIEARVRGLLAELDEAAP